MAVPKVITSQTGGREFNSPGIVDYSLFVGGVNGTHHALKNYSPLMNGFGRLFMVRPPLVLLKMFAENDSKLYDSSSLFIQFKHMMEYMNRSVSGFAQKTLGTAGNGIEGGFAGRKFATPTVTQVTTESVSIGMYEMVGCPIRTIIDSWMNAIGDENSGLATYGGYISGGKDANNFERRLYRYKDQDPSDTYGIPFNEANHTAEFIYVMHDRSGAQVESAVMLADCFPKSIDEGQVLNMEGPGQHENVQYTLEFNCIVYRSPIITAIANDLLKQYLIVSNSLNFNPELGDAIYSDANESTNRFNFNRALGPIPTDSVTGTGIGNLPAFAPTNEPITKETNFYTGYLKKAKQAGQPGFKAKGDSTSNFGEDDYYGYPGNPSGGDNRTFADQNWGYDMPGQ